jgi:hypothetical protein
MVIKFSCVTAYLVPFVLMGLGGVIVWKGQALSPLELLGSCICLFSLVKKNDSNQEERQEIKK